VTTLASFYMHIGAGHWFLMAPGLLILVAVLFWLGTTLAGEKHSGGEAPSEEVSALHLLDRRLAQGEITVEERDRVRKALGPRPRESTQPG
jgi:uncharacterized membrane protein